MNDENFAAAVWLPISHEDYSALRDLLRQEHPVVPGNYEIADAFDLSEYIAANKFEGVEFKALFDRNLLSPLASLANGKPLEGTDESIRCTRLACACAVFCILSDILIEPSMALYEYASTQGNLAAQRDYADFRVTDNANPAFLIDIALGRTDRLPDDHISQIQSDPNIKEIDSPEPNFEKQLRMWRPNYLYVLKIASLRRSGLSALDAALEFQRWQAEESFYNAAASLYCLAAASHQPPKGQMLKGINSKSPESLKKGLFNAVWDIALIQQFGKFSTTPNEASWSLWSLDVAVRAVTRALLARDGQSEREALASFYSCCWGKDGATLHKSYISHSSRVNVGSEARRKSNLAAFSRIDADIYNLEEQLGFARA